MNSYNIVQALTGYQLAMWTSDSKKVCNIALNGNSFTALSGGHLTVTFAYHYNLLMLLACSVKRISFIIVDAYFYPVRVTSILLCLTTD